MSQTAHKIKQRIAKQQLGLILYRCLNDQEILSLADLCGVQSHPSLPDPEAKNRLVLFLCQNFFDQSSSLKKIAWILGRKSKDVIRRVKYMEVDEISLFFGNPGYLQNDDELGQILWAMLMDSRQQVQDHAYYLLTKLNLPEPTDEEKLHEIEKEASHSLISKPVSQVDSEIDTNLPVLPKPEQQKAAEPKKGGSGYLQSILHWNSSDRLENQGSCSNQQVLDLTCQCQNLQQQVQERVQENLCLKEENQILKERILRYESRESVIEKLVEEKRVLQLDLAELSRKLEKQSFPHMEQDKAELTIGLQSLEKSAYRTQQVFDQLRADLQGHLDSLQQVNQDSTANLDWIRQRISTLGDNGQKKVINYTADQPRVGIFVDVQNMFYAAKDRYAGRLDYIKLLDLMLGPRQLTVAYAYIVQIPEIDQSSFVSLLEHNGYTIRTKDLRLRGDGSAKGDWDVGIAVDIAMMLDSLDVVVLASGDGDFCELAELVKRRNKRIEVTAFSHNTSMDLIRSADQFFPISNEMII